MGIPNRELVTLGFRLIELESFYFVYVAKKPAVLWRNENDSFKLKHLD